MHLFQNIRLILGYESTSHHLHNNNDTYRRCGFLSASKWCLYNWNIAFPSTPLLVYMYMYICVGIPCWWEDSGPSAVPVPTHLGICGQCWGRVGCLQWDHEEKGCCSPGPGGQSPDENCCWGQGGRTEDNWTATGVGERKACTGMGGNRHTTNFMYMYLTKNHTI